MKFECDSCHASYMIADEKVGKRGVKVKCKRCSHVIIVRPEKAASGADAPPPDVPMGDEPEASAAIDAAPPAADAASALPPDEGEGPPASDGLPDDEDGGSPWSDGSADAAKSTSTDIEGGATAVGAVPGWPMQSGADTELGAVGSMPDATMPGGAPPPSMQNDDDDAPAPPAFAAEQPSEDEAPAPPAFAAEPPPVDDVPPPPSMDVDVPAPPPDAGVDALDQQIAGAFSDMFGALPDPNAMPASPPPTVDVDQRGPTRVLDLAKMDALRAAAVPSVSEEDPVDRLRTDVGPAASSDDGPDPFAQAFKPVTTSTSTSSGGASSSAQARASMPDDSGGWHVAIDDEDIGPIRLSELVEHIEEGRAEPDALVWRSGMGDWTPANDIPEVAALLRARPMPKIPTSSFEPAGLDAAGGVDGRKKGGVLGDPFSVVADASDPNWRPHGLTEVYQAANLAEVASSARSPTLSTPAISHDEAPDESDAGWKPGAASALASLVADELKRIDSKPVIEDEPAPPALADDLGIGAALVDPPSTGVSAAHYAAPEVSGQMAIPPQYPSGIPQQALPPLESFPPMPSTMSYVPAPAPRSPLIYMAGGAFALLLVIIAAALVKMAFLGPSAPVAAVEPRAAPAAVASTTAEPAEAKPSDAKPAGDAPVEAKPTDEKPADEKPVDAKGDAPEAEKPAEKAADKPVADKPVADDKETRVASSSTNERSSSKDAKPRAQKDPPKEEKPRETRAKPEPKPEPKAEPAASPPPKKKSSKDCDPILDIDCEEKKSASSGSSKKETLTKADILAVVKKNVSKINACGKQHKVTGSVKVEWEIMKSGRTSSVRIGDPKYAGTPVGRCLVTEVQRWTFPAYTGAAPPPIKFPFKLE